jgi:transposase
MADDGCNVYQVSSTFSWSCWRQPRNERIKRGLNSKIHLAVDENGMPIRTIITNGTPADCTKVSELIDGVKVKYLVADKAYDSDEIVNTAIRNKALPIIPPKRNRKVKRLHYKLLYKKRHRVENAFLKMKQWRGIATRYCKNANSFIAAVHIVSMFLWLKIS